MKIQFNLNLAPRLQTSSYNITILHDDNSASTKNTSVCNFKNSGYQTMNSRSSIAEDPVTLVIDR
jgi:hypothetical protein